MHSGDLEVTVEFLIELDKLIQLIESPIFAGSYTPICCKIKIIIKYFFPTRLAPAIVRISTTVGTIAVWNFDANASNRCIPYS